MKTLNTTELDNLRLRVRETMKNTIGEVYDNETLVFINTEGKASASIRLYQHRGYDSLGTMILSPSKDGGMGPLQFALVHKIHDTEDQVLDGKKYTTYRDFIKECSALSEAEYKDILKKRIQVAKDAKILFADESENKSYFIMAYKYIRLMDRKEFDFPFSSIAARLELYHDLMLLDTRYAGVNIEEAFLVRREDHNRIVQSKDVYQMTKFLFECLVMALYTAFDTKSIYDAVSHHAMEYLKTRMERGREYSEEELSKLFGMDEGTFLNLILLPAMSSDELVVRNPAAVDGSSRYSLI